MSTVLLFMFHMCYCYVSVLARVKSFLPELAAANENLVTRINMAGSDADVNIEHIDMAEKHIEMVRKYFGTCMYVISVDSKH